MGNYERNNYFAGHEISGSDPGDPSQYRNLLCDTKEFKSIPNGVIGEWGEIDFGVWIGGQNGVVQPSQDRPGNNQVLLTGDPDEESKGLAFQMFEGLKAGWYTLSARVKIQDATTDSIAMCFVAGIEFETEDDIKIYLDGEEREIIVGYGIIGYDPKNSPDWQVLTANILVNKDMEEGDLLAVTMGLFRAPGTIITELIQFEPGKEATLWTKSINDFK